ncbi:MAG: hypothetical protein R3F30_14110 [Planctomycetota bacterium]
MDGATLQAAERIAALGLEVEGMTLEDRSETPTPGWTRRTTTIVLRGGGHEGRGEDVTYQEPDQSHLQEHGPGLDLSGRYRFAELSRRLDGEDLCFGKEPEDHASRDYRRWGFESAALDLALRQNGLSLAAVLGRELRPLRFVSSLGLGDPAGTAPLAERRARSPGIGFKVDFSAGWTADLVAELRAFGGVDVVDFKGQYHGPYAGAPADAELYRVVAAGLPEAWLEDPDLGGDCAAALEDHRGRLTWDAPLHSLADLEARDEGLRCVNIKPSRFGRVLELLAVYAWCQRRGIAMYAGGQYELGVGRDQIQYLAALFHPDAPNDCAPRDFNRAPLPATLPASPLAPRAAPTGFALA